MQWISGLILFFMGWGVLAGNATASVAMQGNLIASKSCPAYVSLKKQTNPGNLALEVGKEYPAFEINKPKKADWVRIRLDETDFPERWVRMTCGTLNVGQQENPPRDNTDTTINDQPRGDDQETPVASCPTGRCNQPDQEDSFVLSLSWLPAFCESDAGKKKPECINQQPDSYGATHFTLHGLWPNKFACGINYGFCGPKVCKAPPKNGDPLWMCSYPEVPWNGAVPQEVMDVMPSIQAGSCLDRHEWYKHGSCAAPWTPQEYFTVAARLAKEFNAGGMAKIMTDNLGRYVQEKEFLQAIDHAFGPGASNRVSLECSGATLSGIAIQLPANMKGTESLQELLPEAQANSRSNCRNAFLVDPAGR